MTMINQNICENWQCENETQPPFKTCGNCMKVMKSKYGVEETEYSYPIYFHLQDDDAVDNTYIRYTETEVLEIEFTFSGKVSVRKNTHNKEYPLPEYLFNCISCSNTFNEAVEDLKSFIGSL